MKIIALEEHFATPEIMAAWKVLTPELQDLAVKQSTMGDIERRLFDFADERIRFMDEAGIDIQVLSLTTPGVQSLDPEKAVPLARAGNDILAEMVRDQPDRFQGFATLATPTPSEAVHELERAIRELGLNGAILYGRTRDRNLDHPDFLPIFEAAAAMRVPLYLHPQSPRPTVREAYYHGFSDKLLAYQAADDIDEAAASGIYPDYMRRTRIRAYCGAAIRHITDAIDILLSAHGAGSFALSSPMQRIWRDSNTAARHAVILPTVLDEVYGKALLGVKNKDVSAMYSFLL